MNCLDKERLKQNISCNIIVIDNFYENPFEVREFALEQRDDYQPNDYHPGIRSSSFATEKHREMINNIVEPFSGKINKFNISKDKSSNSNGTFQLNVSEDRKSWIHIDTGDTNWAGIIYLTPNAPLSGGTGFFKHKDGNLTNCDKSILQNDNKVKQNRYDNTQWELVNSIGNVFNRLILFRSNQYHMSLDYFGNDFEDGRLIQLFFFKTER
jgi:hypothetical protein